MKKLYGTGVALVTPFLSNGDIDYASLKRVLKHTAKGVDYFVVMGTTGESATLSAAEKSQVLNFVLENNPKSLPVVLGVGGNNTNEVLHQLRGTDLSGVDAILSVSPYYNKPSQRGIAAHFTALADASAKPVILYNVPARTSSNMVADTVIQLAHHENIIGVKEASGNLEQCMNIAKYAPRDFMLISGDDLQTVPMFSIGGVGVISVLANAFPLIFKRMTTYARDGFFKKASQELFKILAINPYMYEEGSPAGVKQLLSEMQLCQPHVRLPLVTVSEVLQQKIKSALAGMGTK